MGAPEHVTLRITPHGRGRKATVDPPEFVDLTALRPTFQPPRDRRHEFLTKWLPAEDAVIKSWVAHFEAHRTPFTLATSGTRVMLYIHKLITPKNAKARTRWCCEA